MSAAIEYWLSFFNGFNHLPNIDASPTFDREPAQLAAAGCPACPVAPSSIVIRRVYPPIRTNCADAAAPTRCFTIKAEAAYFTSSSSDTDEYVLYVVQIERQTGEWVIVGGYASEIVTVPR